MVSTAVKRRLSDASDQTDNKMLKTEPVEEQEPTREERQQKIFSRMHLRRIIKENHGSDIHQLAFFFNNKNFSAPVGLDVNKTFDKRGSVQRQQTDTSNVFASVGGCQMNLYDNEHIGDHLDLMSNFDLGQTEDGKSELHTFCWLYRGDDAQIAAAGTDGNIHLVSIAYSEEIKILQGHTKTIHDLQTHPQSDRYILSTSKDGTVRLWDVDSAKCLVIFEADATVTCFYTSGQKFISGGPRGELREWTIPDYEQSEEPLMVPKKDSRLLKKYNGECYIDCIRFANGNVLSKSINGRLEYWNPETGDKIHSFHVRTGENFSRFDVSLDESFVCIGSSQGSVFIYNLHTGKLVTELCHRRSVKAIHCCVFTRDCRSVLSAGEDGFIWRYDSIDEDTLQEWANWKARTEKESERENE